MNLCLNRQINISWFNRTRCYIESHHYVSLTNGLRYPFINVCVHVTLNRKGSQSRLDLRSTDLQILTTYHRRLLTSGVEAQIPSKQWL